MTKLFLGGLIAAITIAPAAAQPAPPPPPSAPQVQGQTMRMPMRARTRNEVVQHTRDMFARLDTNRDGFLTREEARAARQSARADRRVRFARRLAQRMPADRGAAFDRIDSNKDGTITRQEFLAARPQVRTRVGTIRDGHGRAEVGGAPGQPRVKVMRMRRMAMNGRRFESADANRDGRLSLQEMTNAALQHFDSADLNRDGRITPEERLQRRERVRVQRVQS